MPPNDIDGLEVRSLRILRDDRGAVFHMLRADASHFQWFGEIYFSLVNAGSIKAWHRHRQAIMNYAVPRGRIRLVIYDPRVDSPTFGRLVEIDTGEANYLLITIPAGTWSGFLGLDDTPSLVANCATMPHDPAEIERAVPDTPGIPYRWRADARDPG